MNKGIWPPQILTKKAFGGIIILSHCL